MPENFHGWSPETLYQLVIILRTVDHNHRREIAETERFWRKSLWDAQNSALDKALEAANERLDKMNEFRKTVEDLQGAMLPRKEAWGFLIGGIGMVVALITIIDKFTR